MIRAVLFSFFLLNFSFLVGCGDGGKPRETIVPASAEAKVIVVYSPHGKQLEEDIKKRFEDAHAGYTVEFLDMGGGKILTRLQGEKAQPRADVWWGGAAGDFNRADAQGLLEPYTPEWSKNLPADARSASGAWVATFRTPELIMYNSKKISVADAPKTWDDLLDLKWKGKIVIRDVRPSSTMKTIFGSIILREQKKTGSVDAGFEFLEKLDANTGSYAAEPQLMYDLLDGDGPYAITLWNLADALLLKSNGHSFEYVIPPGAPIPVEPISLVKNSPNPAGAKMFHDFVNSPEQLVLMAKERHRLPARTDLPQDQLPAWMKDLKLQPADMDWAALDKNIDEWIARWERDIKQKK